MSRKKRKSAALSPRPWFLRQPDWLGGLLLVAMTLLAYGHVWHTGYIWDDDVYLTTNRLLTLPDGLRRIWFSLESPSQYFPLVYTTFRWEHALWGLHPLGYHLVNVLLHTANALLAWRLFRALRVPGAWIGAALFALHPVQVESVAWITERKNVLMGLFFLLALICWTRFVEPGGKPRPKFYALALICYALALFSKTTACTLPAALILILWLRHQPITRARVLQVIPFILLGLALGLVSVWWERNHQGTQGPQFSVALSDRLLVASHAVWFYLGKLLWPFHLAFSYPRWSVSSADPVSYFWVFLLLIAVGVVWWLRRWMGRGLEVGLIFFVATLSPLLGFIMLYTFRYSWVADHYQYLACLGPFALLGSALHKTIEKRPLIAFTPILVLCSLGWLTWEQTYNYDNESTLWHATIAANPQSWMAQNNLAIQLVGSGKIEEAIAYYERALALNPTYAEAHYNLGNAYFRLGRIEEAQTEYGKAISIYPGFATAHANLGGSFLHQGRAKEARAELTEARRLAPGLSDVVRDDLVTADLADKDTAAAIAELQEAVRMNSHDAKSQSRLGLILFKSGEADAALAPLRVAAELTPESAPAQAEFANALARVGRREEAISRYREALRSRPDSAIIHNNLANVLAESGRPEEAVAEYDKSLALKANNVAAHKNLARVLRGLGRSEEAEQQDRLARDLEAGLTK